MPAPVLNVPEIRTAHVADVDGRHFTQEDRRKKRRDERDARRLGVCIRILFTEPLDLRPTEAL